MNAASALLRRLASRRALIFDFDGTIADSSALHARAFDEAFGAHGLGIEYPRIAGRSTHDAVGLAFELAGRELDERLRAEVVAAKQARARELIATELALLPGVGAFLAWARPRFALALCSSGSRATLEISLARLGLEGWFSPVVCAEDVVQAKPSPEGFRLALELLGCSPREAMVFEDSEAGLRAAAAAGIEAVDVRPPFRFPEPEA